MNEFNKQYLFYEQWFDNLQRTNESILEQTLTIDERLQRYHDVQIELDKRKQILLTLSHDYPQITQQISQPIQQLIDNIERMKTNVTRKEEVKSRERFLISYVIFQSKGFGRSKSSTKRLSKSY